MLRLDDSERLTLIVAGIDEEGVHVDHEWTTRTRSRLGPGWATFARDGEGYYRFRTSPLGETVLAHGTFLVHEERRRDPRVNVAGDPFWIAVERLPDGVPPPNGSRLPGEGAPPQ